MVRMKTFPVVFEKYFYPNKLWSKCEKYGCISQNLACVLRCSYSVLPLKWITIPPPTKCLLCVNLLTDENIWQCWKCFTLLVKDNNYIELCNWNWYIFWGGGEGGERRLKLYIMKLVKSLTVQLCCKTSRLYGLQIECNNQQCPANRWETQSS